MRDETPKLIINILEEAKGFLKLRPDLFQQINRLARDRISYIQRTTNNDKLLLLYFSLGNFSTPFEFYYDQTFKKRLAENLRKKISEKFGEGETILISSVARTLDIGTVTSVERGISEERIHEKVEEKLKILGDEGYRKAFSEIISTVEQTLQEVSREGSEELMKIYDELEEIIKDKGDIEAVRRKLEEYTVEFDRKIRKEFVVS